MEFTLSPQIQAALDQAKNQIAQNIFDQVTGGIKGALINQGVDIKTPSQAVPEAKQTSESTVVSMANYAPYIIGLAVVIGGYMLLKKSKGRV